MSGHEPSGSGSTTSVARDKANLDLIWLRDESLGKLGVARLKARAAEQGVTLAAYLRNELERLAARPTNAEVVERLAQRDREGGPTEHEIVAEVRRTREAS